MENKTLTALVFCLCLVGCSTHELAYDETKRQSTTSIEIFREGMKPTKPYKEIAELTYVGYIDEEPDAKTVFMRRAKKLGANGLIFLPRTDTGYQFHFGGKSGKGANFKAIAIIYE